MEHNRQLCCKNPSNSGESKISQRGCINPGGGGAKLSFGHFFHENCMKMKFGPEGGVPRAP